MQYRETAGTRKQSDLGCGRTTTQAGRMQGKYDCGGLEQNKSDLMWSAYRPCVGRLQQTQPLAHRADVLHVPYHDQCMRHDLPHVGLKSCRVGAAEPEKVWRTLQISVVFRFCAGTMVVGASV
jgi:hypothetical protein